MTAQAITVLPAPVGATSTAWSWPIKLVDGGLLVW